MLLTALPGVVRVNVRGSNAGIWLESSVRYALAEARSPRPQRVAQKTLSRLDAG